jgi:protein-disulfide isomerase
LKTLKDFYTRFLPHRSLHILLAVSVLTNIVFVLKLYYPDITDNILAAMASPPRVEPADHIRGNPNAKVTVIAYTDYECSYCARLHTTLHTLAKETDIRLVYRHFPLASHQYAERAAEAAECAGAQGRFWEYSDDLFKSINKVHGDADLIRIASNLGMESKLFAGCLSSGQFSNRVAAQRVDGFNRRLMAVPTFFVNGKRFNGAISADQLKSFLIKSGA